MSRRIALNKIFTNRNDSVDSLSRRKKVLLVFLRHFGCVFCREALEDLANQRDDIERHDVRIILVHMTDEATAKEYFERYNIDDLDSVSDPNCIHYQQFGLVKGSFKQLFGLRSWIRGFDAGVLQGHGVGKMLGDGFQMPGVFLIENGQILTEFIHENASDRPNYMDMLSAQAV